MHYLYITDEDGPQCFPHVDQGCSPGDLGLQRGAGPKRPYKVNKEYNQGCTLVKVIGSFWGPAIFEPQVFGSGS